MALILCGWHKFSFAYFLSSHNSYSTIFTPETSLLHPQLSQVHYKPIFKKTSSKLAWQRNWLKCCTGIVEVWVESWQACIFSGFLFTTSVLIRLRHCDIAALFREMLHYNQPKGAKKEERPITKHMYTYVHIFPYNISQMVNWLWHLYSNSQL